jgi:hypothetical protein
MYDCLSLSTPSLSELLDDGALGFRESANLVISISPLHAPEGTQVSMQHCGQGQT